MPEKFSLKDHLFNDQSIADLAADFAAGVPGFNAADFHAEVMSGLAQRELMARLEWIADCVEKRLPADFPRMANALEAAMPPRLDPGLRDDDFGRFIHAVPGILAVRHGLEDHRDRALDLLYEATQRFSMEFYIRPFLNRWERETLARLTLWARDDNYHVRRLVSEGTRPKLPWAKNVSLSQGAALPLLEMLYADPTRYVTRSVANHLNDIAKTSPEMVIETLSNWHAQRQQETKELAWLTRHALRTLVKQGHFGALEMLGYRYDAPVSLDCIHVTPPDPAPGDAIEIRIVLSAPESCPVLVDYVLWSVRKDGSTSPKVFKLKQAVISPGKHLTLHKKHVLKADATTFTLYPGQHRVEVQVNGKVLGSASFDLKRA